MTHWETSPFLSSNCLPTFQVYLKKERHGAFQTSMQLTQERNTSKKHRPPVFAGNTVIFILEDLTTNHLWKFNGKRLFSRMKKGNSNQKLVYS